MKFSLWESCRSAVTRSVRNVLLLTSLTAIGTSAQAQTHTTIATTSSWDGVSNAPLLSRDFSSSIIGQTFQAPSGVTALSGLSFFLGYAPFFYPNDLDLQFYAYVYGWNGIAPTSQLWRSSVQNGETDIPLVQRGLSTPISVVAGDQYVVLLSTLESDPFDPVNNCFVDPFAKCPAFQNVGVTGSNAYSGGDLIQGFATSWNDFGNVQWAIESNADLAFSLQFDSPAVNVIPEPGSLQLISLGLAIGCVFVRRRVRRVQL